MERTTGGPAISVIVPVYNSGATIDATLASIAAQTHKDFEVVVVDDGSTDESAERVEARVAADSRFRLIRQPNSGTAGGARNGGAREARGRILSFLDADDAWLPTYLERVAGALERSPDAAIAIGDAWVVDDARRLAHRWGAVEFYRAAIPPLPARVDAEEALCRILRLNFVTVSTSAITREAFTAAGGFDLSIKGSDDWDLWIRVLSARGQMVRVGERLTALRSRPDSQSSDVGMMTRNSLAVLRKALAAGELPPRAAEVARAHQRMIEGELPRYEDKGGGGLRAQWWAAQRRLARRIRLPLRRYWVEPPAEVAALLWGEAPSATSRAAAARSA